MLLFIDMRGEKREREMIQFTLMMLPMADDKANKEPSKASWRRLRTHFRAKENFYAVEKYQEHKLLINNSNSE